MSIDKARAYLAQFGMDGRVIEFETSSATVELAAQAAGTEPARIAKTLSFMIDGAPALVVCAGDTRTGQSLVVRALADGRACAREVDAFLKQKNAF